MEPRQVVPLSQRRGDILIVAFFLLNLCFITYIVDFEQLVIPDPSHFVYPIWPPHAMVDLVHWWGHTFDPLLMARPVWWKVTILFDAVFFGPFYACAIYAYLKGKEWIRLPSIIWASMLFTVTTIIVFEEIYGTYRSPQLPIVLLANAPWILMPIFVVYRMGRSPHPFTRMVTADDQLEAAQPAVRLNPHQV
ncbi:MAG TPA: emopamil-binding family protein [Anaerolineae bacterium]|nr:emopamil-binding family protein [Anaerolineae bacterium]